MKQNKARGIIIRKTNFSDNDIIFDLLTDEGKVIGFFARGARKLKSRYSGTLQIGMVVIVTYTAGKNLQYPNEINLDAKHLFSFYRKSLKHMDLYMDVISILKTIGKDLEDPELFSITLECFDAVEKDGDLINSYNEFLNKILHLISIESSLNCAITGETINEKEFYYVPESNKVISEANKPHSLNNLTKINYSESFYKEYLQKLILEHVHNKLRLKF
jgi:DNA repair protein RecO